MTNKLIINYLENKEPHIFAVKQNISNFMRMHDEMHGEKDYLELRDSNIIETGSFSATIPWIIADLCGVKSESCIEIASAWESILLYARQLDTISDKHSLTKKDKKLLLSASMLLIHGIDELKNIMGTESNCSLQPIYEATKYQRKDIQLSGYEFSSDVFDEEKHLEIMRGKNIFVKTIVNFYLKKGKISRKKLNEFIDNLATFAQLIDDLKDIDEDFRNGCYSHLRHSLKGFPNPNDKNISISNFLLSKGLMHRSVQLAIKFLSNAIEIVFNQYNSNLSKISSAKAFELYSFLEAQKEELEELLRLIIKMESKEHLPLCDEITLKQKINRLCFGT